MKKEIELTPEIIKNFEKCTTKTEIGRLLGFKFYNGMVCKEVNKLIDKNIINFSMLGNREHKRKYDRIIKKCPICNTEFETLLNDIDEKYTCSIQCSNIYFVNKRISQYKGIKKNAVCATCGSVCEIGKSASIKTAMCPNCRLYRYRNRYRILKTCCNCNKEFFTSHKATECCSTSCGIKYSYKMGISKGWTSRKKLVPSYPEKYFMEVLKNDDISYEYEKKAGKYFIDFALNEKMIALEIDGKQHELPERKKSDMQKDIYLTENGWKVFRIRWYNPCRERSKQLLYNQINDFRNFYKSIQWVG